MLTELLGDLWLKQRTALLAILIFFAWIIVSGMTISSFGLNEDSPFHFLRGQAYLTFLTAGRKAFDQPRLLSPVLFIPGQRISTYKFNAWEENLSPIKPIAEPGKETLQGGFSRYLSQKGRISFYEHNGWDGQYFIENDGPGHPPVSDVLAALTNRIFYGRLGWLGDIEAYHFYSVLVSGLLVVGVFLFAYLFWGRLAGFLAAVTLAFYPIFMAEAHFNIKDIPETAFFGLSLMAFYVWFKGRKTFWLGVFMAFCFLALGTKLNALFIPVILTLFLGLSVKTIEFKKWFSGKTVVYGLVSVAVVLTLFVLIWPYLWAAPVARIIDLLKFYLDVGRTDIRVENVVSQWIFKGVSFQGVMEVLGATPIVVLIFFLFGLVAKRKAIRPGNPELFVVLWFSIPLVRTLIPSAANSGSLRQYLEFLPAMAIVSGWGGAWLISAISERISIFKGYLVIFICSLYVLVLALINVSWWPNQNVYFNFLVGGLSGALERDLSGWQSSYDNPYKRLIMNLNGRAEKGAKLAYLDGSMEGISPLWLRSDIVFGSSFSGYEQRGEYVATLVYPNPPAVFPYLYLERCLVPIDEVRVSGISLGRLYQNSPKYLHPECAKVERLSALPELTFGTGTLGNYWQIDLGQVQRLVSLRVKGGVGNCVLSEGVFFSDHYLVPYRLDRGNGESGFFFPGERIEVLKYYPVEPNSCLTKVKILGIDVFK